MLAACSPSAGTPRAAAPCSRMPESHSAPGRRVTHVIRQCATPVSQPVEAGEPWAACLQARVADVRLDVRAVEECQVYRLRDVRGGQHLGSSTHTRLKTHATVL